MRISIELKDEEFDAIRRMASHDRRTPREQAAWLLSTAIAQRSEMGEPNAAAAPGRGNGAQSHSTPRAAG